MKLQRECRTLKDKAISSLRVAMQSFNSYDEDGRITTTLLHLQHACEMLLKAVLCQKRVSVFDKATGKSIGFEKCLRLCEQDHDLSKSEAGIMRTVDGLRDAAQHWFLVISEEMLYMNTRALITAFDAYLNRMLELDLVSHIPPRVLPVSTTPPGDFEFLFHREYAKIGELLQPGKRQRDEARGRIRSLLAMEALVTDEVEVSEKDIDRIEKAIRVGEEPAVVFPRLISVGTASEGDGVTLKVQLVKKEGAPIMYVGGDDPAAAAAIREVDMRKKFHMRASDLARKLKMTEPKANALRQHLRIDEDASCFHAFEFGKSKFPCFSDNAHRQMKAALDGGLSIDDVWRARKAQLAAQ
ncbi:hypothetical protein OIU35_07060 [Boseaceae bacterium BT-24-1]|nr:hypothetical protein [Boseaceae bacterium BT-24-1]